MGGWRDYKTMMIYIRLAGMETVGATEGLNFDLASSTQNLNMSATQWSKFDNIFSKDKEKKSTPEKEVVSELLPDNVINLFG